MLRALCVWLVLAIAAPVAAQDVPVSAVLTIDVDRVFASTQLGQRIVADLTAEGDALIAENRRIETALTAEVQDLTRRRPNMDVAAFRVEADAFDEKVQAIRAAQDAKERAVEQSLGAGREAVFDAVRPILGQLMQARGASVILDRRSVFLSLGAVDITDAAIARIDTDVGDGRNMVVIERVIEDALPDVAPDLVPDPGEDVQTPDASTDDQTPQ